MATIEVSKLENNSIQINIDNNEENNYIAKKDTRIAELEGKIDQLTAHSDIEWQNDKWISEVQE